MKTVIQSTLSLALACSAASALAADLPKEGKYAYTACWAGTSKVIPFSKTQIGMSYELFGTTRTEPPGGMFDKSSFQCVGSNAIFDKKFTSIVTCVAVNADGDKVLSYYHAGDDRKYARQTIAGTGKYAGIVINTTEVKPLGPYPVVKPGNFQGCNHQSGTYKLK